MTDKVIAFQRKDGGVSVVNPVWTSRHRNDDGEYIETEDAFLARVAEWSVPEDVMWRVVERSELPAYDSATRNRWQMVGGVVSIAPLPDPLPGSDNGGSIAIA